MILTTLIVTLIVMSPTILFFLAFVIEGYMYKCPKINLSDKEDLKILKKGRKNNKLQIQKDRQKMYRT